MSILRKLNPAVVAIALVAALAVTLLVLMSGGGTKTLYADFPRTVSLYSGSDVRIMGVSVGQVDSVTPTGQKVRAKLTYSDSIKLPDDVKAVIISPSVVGDRFVQLTPGYTTGPALPANTTLGCGQPCGDSGDARTAVPLELDEIFGSISQLTVALGPQGANAAAPGQEGALSRLLDVTARNFGGAGTTFNATLHNLGNLTKTLADNKDNLFATQGSIEKFVNTLAANDGVVRQFNDTLASGANLLASERTDLAAALDNLAVAVDAVRGYVHDNRTMLSADIDSLTRVSDTLAARRAELAETLKVAPLALSNLALTYDKNVGATDTRSDVGNLPNALSTNPSAILCSIAAPVLNGATCPFAALPRTAVDQVRQAQDAATPRMDLTWGGLVQ